MILYFDEAKSDSDLQKWIGTVITMKTDDL